MLNWTYNNNECKKRLLRLFYHDLSVPLFRFGSTLSIVFFTQSSYAKLMMIGLGKKIGLQDSSLDTAIFHMGN